MANSRYEAMSDGWWLSDYGVESLLTAAVAERLTWALRVDEPRVLLTLEEALSEVTGHLASFVIGSGRRPMVDESGRVDIAIWKPLFEEKAEEEKWHPIGVVEMKRNWNFATAKRDFQRLTRLTQSYGGNAEGQLRYAVFGTFLFEAGFLSAGAVREKYAEIDKCLESELQVPFETMPLPPFQTQHKANSEYWGGGYVIGFKRA